MAANEPHAAFPPDSPLGRACSDPVAALALLVEACERGETNLRSYLDAGAAAVAYAAEPTGTWVERAWRETAEERKVRLDALTLSMSAVVAALDLTPVDMAQAEKGDPKTILDRIEEIVDAGLAEADRRG